jgi:hypothetical protein
MFGYAIVCPIMSQTRTHIIHPLVVRRRPLLFANIRYMFGGETLGFYDQVSISKGCRM